MSRVSLASAQAAMLARVLTGENLARAVLLDAGAMSRGDIGRPSAPCQPASRSPLFWLGFFAAV